MEEVEEEAVSGLGRFHTLEVHETTSPMKLQLAMFEKFEGHPSLFLVVWE